ncbi:MAG: hypothetical protein LBS84_02330 [Clostridiales bacterium]|jgi:hypothetical protein|nr:hypothetical protein [Clostridiales bacterium]
MKLSLINDEPTVDFYEVTPVQCGKIMNPPISGATVLSRCKQGILPFKCYRTEGGHWKILLPKKLYSSNAIEQTLKNENAKLKLVIEAVKDAVNTL